MKKVILAILALVVVMPFGVFADGIPAQKITLEQKGAFESVAHIAQNDFEVPTMVDAPLEFDENARVYAIVTDSSDVIVPSTIITKTQSSSLNLSAEDSFGSVNANNMIDGQGDTYVEFPFVEGNQSYEVVDVNVAVRNSVNGGVETMQSQDKFKSEDTSDEESGDNVVVIDINSDRIFSADSLKFTFDKNIQKPTRIKLVSVKSTGEEQILLPEQFFVNDKISFPQANTKHYRITLNYIKPLRINEITFFEKGVPTITKNAVRFIAQPKTVYNIYYNTDEFVKTKPMESPNFSVTDDNVQKIQIESVENNPVYQKADADKDGILDSQDNCINVANADQIDKDNNGKGDACEDFDRDGVINAVDNCILVANHNQFDKDMDGIGDACDEMENRFVERYPWIIYIVLTIVFVIVVGLIVKTMKR